MEPLMGVPEIAEMLGLSRQGVYRILERDDRFPEPVATIAAGRIWEREALERWAAERGRADGTASPTPRPRVPVVAEVPIEPAAESSPTNISPQILLQLSCNIGSVSVLTPCPAGVLGAANSVRAPIRHRRAQRSVPRSDTSD
jgi:prophage regulatory protein